MPAQGRDPAEPLPWPGAVLAAKAREAPAANGAARRRSARGWRWPQLWAPHYQWWRKKWMRWGKGRIVLSLVLKKECVKEIFEMVKIGWNPLIEEFVCSGVKFQMAHELRIISREACEDRVKFRNSSNQLWHVDLHASLSPVKYEGTQLLS
jgi:hypothetical protein